jgi:hypothetical protein
MGADVVIAVNLDRHCFDGGWKPGWYSIADNSLSILKHHLALLGASRADVVIDIEFEKIGWYQFTNGRDKIIAGERATEEIVPQLENLLLLQNKPANPVGNAGSSSPEFQESTP